MQEPAGFRDYVAQRQTALLRLGWLLTGSEVAAEDVVQTALTRVWPRWEKVCATGDPDGYVRQTVVNVAARAGRRRWRGEVATGSLPEVALDDLTGVVAERERLAALLRSLTPRQRAVVVLRFYEDRSVEQVADQLGVSTGTVKSTSARALAALRVALSEESS